MGSESLLALHFPVGVASVDTDDIMESSAMDVIDISLVGLKGVVFVTELCGGSGGVIRVDGILVRLGVLLSEHSLHLHMPWHNSAQSPQIAEFHWHLTPCSVPLHLQWFPLSGTLYRFMHFLHSLCILTFSLAISCCLGGQSG